MNFNEAMDKAFDTYASGEEPPAEPPVEATSGSADEPDKPEASSTEQPVYDIEGVGKLTAAEVKSLREAAVKAEALEQRLSETTNERERLAVWRQMDDIANKHPELRDKLVAVFDEYRKSEPASEPIKEREVSDEERVRNEWIDRQMVEAAGKEIDTLVSDYAAKFPDLVKPTDDWLSQVLLPAVVERFGDTAGLKQIKMTLNDLVVESGGFQRAEENGAARLASRLASEPRGSRIVHGPTPRVNGDAPPPNIKGKDFWDTLSKGVSAIPGLMTD